MSTQITLDVEKLTFDDWAIIEDFQEGKVKARSLKEVIVRASGLTAEQVGALPPSAIRDCIEALGNSLGSVLSQKN